MKKNFKGHNTFPMNTFNRIYSLYFEDLSIMRKASKTSYYLDCFYPFSRDMPELTYGEQVIMGLIEDTRENYTYINYTLWKESY
jgi:hypothetical protein